MSYGDGEVIGWRDWSNWSNFPISFPQRFSGKKKREGERGREIKKLLQSLQLLQRFQKVIAI